jgi:hypothetical protein
MERPTFLKKGEPARLFPVLADSSKEGRALSIFLACFAHVPEFGRALMTSLGQRTGARTRFRVFTEVEFASNGGRNNRPDGILIVESGRSSWSALIEAKIGNAELTTEQLTAYCEIAKANGIDAIITISNQFAPLPTHHPLKLPASLRKKVEIFHWSWMYLLTQASLLIENEEIADDTQRVLLQEFIRFLSHESTGAKSFTSMPAEWPEIAAKIHAGGAVKQSAEEVKDVVGAWHQELRDLGLILTRQLKTEVKVRIPRKHVADPVLRLKDDVATLCTENRLEASFQIPAAASPLELVADVKARSITTSMRLRAPEDKKSTKARLTWLLRQIGKAELPGTHIRLYWPGRGGATQYALDALRENADIALPDRKDVAPHTFEIIHVSDLGARFTQRKNFISDLESAVPAFYEQIGQYLKAWQPSAPRMPEDRASKTSVEPAVIAEEVAQDIAEGQSAGE